MKKEQNFTNMNLESVTNAMNNLEVEISREQNYISKHGVANDDGEYDSVWEEYKVDAARNLAKWDELKKLRDNLKSGK